MRFRDAGISIYLSREAVPNENIVRKSFFYFADESFVYTEFKKCC